jgi:hypothetical protein
VIALVDHEIVAAPAGGWGNQAIKLEERQGRADTLRLALIAFTVMRHIDA